VPALTLPSHTSWQQKVTICGALIG
jgi:hypothetical protein